MKRSNRANRNTKCTVRGEKGIPDNVVLVKSCAQGDEKLKGKFDAIKEVIHGKIPGADPASCERKGLRDFLGLNDKRKLMTV